MSTVKTAISIDESVYNEAEELAASTGGSRRAFYSTAIKSYIVACKRRMIKEEYDRYYAEHGDDDDDAKLVAGMKTKRRNIVEPEAW